MSQSSIRTEARQRAEETQRRLIAECTCRIVAEDGLEAATFRRIASDLGCTTGLVTHYYPAKEDLLEAALHVALQGLAADYDGAAAPRTLDEWVDQFVNLLPTSEPTRVFWRVFGAFQAASLSDERMAHVARHFADRGKPSLRALIAGELPRAQARRADELTDTLWLMVDGIGVSVALHGAQLPAERIRDALRGLWRGLLGHSLDNGGA